MAKNNRVETHFTGDTKDIERKLAQLDQRMNRFANQAQKSTLAASQGFKQMDAQANALKATLAASAGAFAAAFTVQEIVALADTFTQFEAKLINANVAAADMAKTQEALFAIAKANGAEIVSVGDLYGSLAMATSDLGTSQADLMKITETVAASLKLSGASAAASASTILQLGQAIAGGKLQAQEYNSIIDASPALMRGLADAIPEAAGNMGKLRQMMLDGKLTVDVLVPALARMNEEMVNKAAKAPQTVATAMQNLQTSLIQYIGSADSSLDVTQKMAYAINMIGENLDELGAAIMIVATALAAKGAASMVSYTYATTAAGVASVRLAIFQAQMTASMTGTSRATLLATSAMKGFSAATAFAGGPLGLAFMAIAAAVFMVHKRLTGATQASKGLDDATTNLTKAYDAYKEAVELAAKASGKERDAALKAAEAKRQEYIDTINAAKAKIADARAAIENAKAKIEAAKMLVKADREMRGAAGYQPGDNAASAGVAITAGIMTQEANNEFSQTTTSLNAITDELNRITADLRGTGTRPPRGGGGTGDSETGGRSSRGSTGPSAEEVAQNSADLLAASSRALVEVQAQALDTAQSRHDLAVQQLAWERDDAKTAIDRQLAEKQITAAAADEAKLSADKLYEAKLAIKTAERSRELEEERLTRARDQVAHEDAIARIKEDTLRYLAGSADTLAERMRYEREAFESQQKAELANLEARHEEARARERLAGAIDAEAEARRGQERAAFDDLQKAQKSDFDKKQLENNPYYKHVQSARDLGHQAMESMSDALDTFGDGIADAITQTGSLADAFKNATNQMIADLVRLAVQRVVIAPLAEMLGGLNGSGGKSSTGKMGFAEGAPSILDGLGGIFGSKKGGLFGGIGKLFGFQAGTNYFAQGGLAMVGEAGPELVNLPKGSQVMPNQKFDQLLAGKRQRVSTGSNVALNINVNANNAVLADQIRREVAEASMAAVQQARMLSQNDNVQRQRRSYR